MTAIGPGCSHFGTTGSAGSTYMYADGTISGNGVITSWCISISTLHETSVAKLKVFRSNGSNWDLVAEDTNNSLTTGTNTRSGLNVSVQTGDYVAFYTNCGGYCGNIYCDGSGASFNKYTDEATGSTAKSSWTIDTRAWSFSVTYTLTLDNVYVNSSTGSDSNTGDSCIAGHPVQTFQKAYDLLSANGVIYVCNSGADFSGETITFTKGLSMTVNGGNGNFFMPKFI